MIDKVTYTEIVEALSRKTGFSKQKCESFAKALIKEVKTELKENGKASITNFGSFKVKEVAERQGQNPQTGEPITIPAHKRITFSPYKALRKRVNAKYEHLEAELVDDNLQQVPAIPTEKPEKVYEEAVKDQSNRIYSILAMAVLLIVISLGLLWVSSNWGSEEITETETTEQPITEAPSNAAEPEAETEVNEPSEAIPPTTGDNLNEEQPTSESITENNATTGTNESTSPEPVSTYQVQEDEWYWVIAEEEYGEAHYWPIIFQENFSGDHHPDSLEPNTQLAIPALEGILTVSDYERLSEASQMVSDAYANFGRNDKAAEYARFAVRWERMAEGEKPE